MLNVGTAWTESSLKLVSLYFYYLPMKIFDRIQHFNDRKFLIAWDFTYFRSLTLVNYFWLCDMKCIFLKHILNNFDWESVQEVQTVITYEEKELPSHYATLAEPKGTCPDVERSIPHLKFTTKDSNRIYGTRAQACHVPNSSAAWN